jgi:hypothetical protein
MNPTHRYELGVRRGAGGREVFVRQTIGAFVSTATAVVAMPGDGPLVLEVRSTPLEYAFFAGTPGALREIEGVDTVSLERGRGRFHRRLLRPLRHGQRSSLDSARLLRVLRVRRGGDEEIGD